MTTAPGVLCRCGGIVRGRICDTCGPKRDTRQRKDRVYDKRAWRDRLRPAFLRDNQLCVDCLERGRTTLSTEIHHKLKASTNPDKALEWDNLLALCHACHSERTRAGE